MSFNGLDNEIARLILLQRIELASPFISKIRKFFGRYLFTNFFTKFFLSKNEINLKYYELMGTEYKSLKRFINFEDKKLLSIGSGMAGLELIIDSLHKNNQFSIIEKNYVSKKVKYGWDDKNLEGYNNLNILREFLKRNQTNAHFRIYDFDKDDLPDYNFDIVLSLYSLDYHYDFNVYKEYLKKISSDQTQIVFDTVRPDYFNNIFDEVKIIKTIEKKIHSSKRIICRGFIK
jgi:hypothetical protein